MKVAKTLFLIRIAVFFVILLKMSAAVALFVAPFPHNSATYTQPTHSFSYDAMIEIGRNLNQAPTRQGAGAIHGKKHKSLVGCCALPLIISDRLLFLSMYSNYKIV